MSHKSSTNARILQPEIPPPSTNPERPPKPPPLPLNSAPLELISQEGTSPKGFWFFRRNSSHRAGPKNASSKRGGVGAPQLERSWSEPNSPTDPGSAGFASRSRPEDSVNYLTMAGNLLEESKVRFYGNMKAWNEFNDRHKSLFANGKPIGNKLVKSRTPIPGAQAEAKSIVRDIQAALDAMDLEMLIDDNSISTTESKAPKNLPEARIQKDVTPPRTFTPEPWFDPATLNPSVLEKVNKHRSINPEGTWHGHSRSRSTAAPRTLPIFEENATRNKEVVKVDQVVGYTPPSAQQLTGPNTSNNVREKEDNAKQLERDRDRGKGKENERDKDRERERDEDLLKEQSAPSREPERGRRDRSRHHRDNVPLLEIPPRPEHLSRERQLSDPVIYTHGTKRRSYSPESIAPAVYTLAEDVEVRDGNTSADSSGTTLVGTRNLAGVGVPRIPTILDYSGSTYDAFGIMSPRPKFAQPGAGPSTLRNNDQRRNGNAGGGPLAPVAEAPSSSSRVAGSEPSNATSGYRRRRRSRSLGHELDGRANRERPRSRSPEDRPRGRDYKYSKDRERERVRDRLWERHDRDWDRERDKDDRERDRDERSQRGKDRERERDRDRDRQKDKERDREKGKDREREKDRDKDKDRNRERDRDKERYREKGKDKERERDKDQDRYGSTRSRPIEDERDRQDPGSRREKDRDRDRDKAKGRDRDRDRERDRDRDRDRPREKDKKKDRERDGRDRERERGDRYRDRDRTKDYTNHPERDPPASAPPGATFITPDTTPTVAMPGSYYGGSIPVGTSPGLTVPPLQTRPALLKFGVHTYATAPPDPNSESRFMEILTSPAPQMPYHLPGQP